MKFVAVSLFLCVLSGANADTAGQHPIEKVIGLLKSLKAKAIAEGQEEAVSFGKFEYWCSTSIDTLKDAIAEETETIDELTDKIAGLTKEKETLEDEIETLEEQIGDLEASAKKAKDDRGDEEKLYNKANKDLGETIKAVDECIKALNSAESKTESMMLAQRRMKAVFSFISLKVTKNQREVLEAFANEKPRPDQLAAGDLDAHVDKYDFKSENIIELLKQLKLKFEDDKLAGTKAETNAQNSYDVAKAARDNQLKAANKSKKQKETKHGKVEKAIADADKKLKATESDKKDDSKTLSDTEDACRIKKSEWDERSKTRSLEIEAMDQAVKILGKSAGVRTEAPSNPIPPASPVKFLQVSQERGVVNDPKMKAVALLKEAAKDSHSRALDRLAVEVAAHLNGPFDQVNNMIEKMIFRLMDEQKQEDEHKLWCDQEIEKTNTMKDDKDEKIKDLKAEIKVETAAVGTLTDEIEDAETMLADIAAFVKEATEIRNTGKKENALAIKDAQDAQKSLTNAIAVLTAFYKESGEIKKEPWEFIQKPVNLPKNPSTWDAGYTGVADPDKRDTGIISILEAVQADFAQMEAETKSQDAQDQKEFEEEMQANDIEKAGRTQEVTMKTQEKARRNDKIASLSSQKKDTEGELEKTEQYLTDLKPACVNGDSSYEDRKKARSTEIEALKKAQVILLDAFKEKPKKFLQIQSHSQ
jgi:DNA repair exonuclease SbcCD ATPase subunit